MGEKVTALDVAERAGVSRSAVSRVFTPGASVSERTAKKVRSAAEALGYRPNVLARSLITGRSRIDGATCGMPPKRSISRCMSSARRLSNAATCNP